MGERAITVMELLEMVFNKKQPKKIRFLGNEYMWCIMNTDMESVGDYIRIAENGYNGIIYTFQEDAFSTFGNLLSTLTMWIRIVEENPDMKETVEKDIWHWHMDDDGLTINKTDEDATSDEVFDWKNGYMEDVDVDINSEIIERDEHGKPISGRFKWGQRYTPAWDTPLHFEEDLFSGYKYEKKDEYIPKHAKDEKWADMSAENEVKDVQFSFEDCKNISDPEEDCKTCLYYGSICKDLEDDTADETN